MTDEQIIEMAKQCGSDPFSLDIFAFARLIQAEQREADAALFDGEVWAYDYREIAAAIRSSK